MSDKLPIIYLGPSMPLNEAKEIINAEFRPPIKRGDLVNLSPNSRIAIIDGVFEQNLSVSPKEIIDILSRGAYVFGGSSMGALRAAEVPGMIGVGRVFQWYRDKIITRDDEVALLFDPYANEALTVPMVNVRFAIERLCSLGTIDYKTGNSIIEAALKIHYKERTYPFILEKAGLTKRSDYRDLFSMLQVFDIKYEDAKAVLEAIEKFNKNGKTNAKQKTWSLESSKGQNIFEEKCSKNDEKILIWESGDAVDYEELIIFLAFTGQLEKYIYRILFDIAPKAFSVSTLKSQVSNQDVQSVFESVVRRWGWMSSEETKVTLADLNLDLESVTQSCIRQITSTELIKEVIRSNDKYIKNALKTQLFMQDMSLKREVMRTESLRSFGQQGNEDVINAEELTEVQSVICKLFHELYFSKVCERWEQMNFSDKSLQNTLISNLAHARRYAKALAASMNTSTICAEESLKNNFGGLQIVSCPKQPGESRFCQPLSVSESYARIIAEKIGITRIGMIGELAGLHGVHVAQAARPGNAWSSSYGSGKSQSVSGAVIGGIMEEVEKWAQEKFVPDDSLIVGSYKSLKDREDFINPATLDLPYDSGYNEDLSLQWYPCFDILNDGKVYSPVDPLTIKNLKHDIYYSKRGARKHMATNGLGCGFSLEEALLHGVCEYVERHSQRLAELLLSNPGGLGNNPFHFVDIRTCSKKVWDLAQNLAHIGGEVRVLNITSEIKIPTFLASITRDFQRADGYGTHPDPNTAIEMALLEAAQTIASSIAGGREDLTIKARSLGRHERPRPISLEDLWFWMDRDTTYIPIDEIISFYSTDIYEDIIWCIEQIRSAGIKHILVANLTRIETEPAHIVRVLIPSLETNNPFYTGPRARLTLLSDMLPNWKGNR